MPTYDVSGPIELDITAGVAAVDIVASDRSTALVEVGVGLSGEHLHLVAETHQLARQVADVDALSSTVGLAPVGQHGDAHRAIMPTGG